MPPYGYGYWIGEVGNAGSVGIATPVFPEYEPDAKPCCALAGLMSNATRGAITSDIMLDCQWV